MKNINRTYKIVLNFSISTQCNDIVSISTLRNSPGNFNWNNLTLDLVSNNTNYPNFAENKHGTLEQLQFDKRSVCDVKYYFDGHTLR